MIDCPSCKNGRMRVIETRNLLNGTCRRRYMCQQCNYRSTIWDGERPPPGWVPSYSRRKGSTKPRLTIEEVRLVLTSHLSSRKLSSQIGRSRGAINDVRRGRRRANVLPELPRLLAAQHKALVLSCHKCANWRRGHCAMDIPDPITEGPSFARDCDHFSSRKEL